MNTVNRVRKPARLNLRARLTAAFVKIARAVDARTADRRMKDYYRSSGAAWKYSLN